MGLAPDPVVLFVYNRPDHTRQTLAALRNNRLAASTRLYVFSDAPRTDADRQAVHHVRQLLDQLNGFLDVVRVDRLVNMGLAGNVIDGVSHVLTHHSRVIVLEDDIVTSPSFLFYMKQALDHYQAVPTVFSISGYALPIQMPPSYAHDVYLSPRCASWGWATWKDRWEKVDWDVSDYPNFKHDFRRRALFNQGGNDLSNMLDEQMAGKLDSWAIRWAYAHYLNQAWCVYPVRSQVVNIGMDGTGTHHTTSTQKYQSAIAELDVVLPDDIKPDPVVIARFRSFYDVTWQHRIKVWMFRKWRLGIKRLGICAGF